MSTNPLMAARHFRRRAFPSSLAAAALVFLLAGCNLTDHTHAFVEELPDGTVVLVGHPGSAFHPRRLDAVKLDDEDTTALRVRLTIYPKK